jgi:hypothetical protein
MTVVEKERFARGMTWSEYLAQATRSVENRQANYAAVDLTEAQKERLAKLKAAGLAKVLVLEEDWCGDAVRSGPVLARIADEAGLEARWFLRDQNLDIMDRYLENGTSRSIPVFLFMDADLNLLLRWGSRPQRVAAVRKALPPLPAKEDPDYAAAFETYRAAIQRAYAEDYPNFIVEDILEHLEAALAAK